MLQQLPTTHLATIQRALDLYQQGRGPHLLGSFLVGQLPNVMALVIYRPASEALGNATELGS